jgi:beta-glucosidase
MTTAGLPPLGYGVATSAYQIEGATEVDGRGPSIWDTFAQRPGAIADGSDGSVACASYERLEEDLDLVAGLGVSSYRFSLAWPRIQPDGRGAVEPRGLDHYDRLVDGLLSRGLRPMATLYHWDLPQALEDDGGWAARDTSARFAEYAAVVGERLADRVRSWATLNEPWCSAFLGYAAGIHAPGRSEPAAAFAAAHHLLLGHGLAAQALRSASSSADVGIVLNLAPVWPEEGADPAAVDVVDAVQNRIWLDPLVHGRYPQVLPAMADAQLVQPGDLDTVQGSAAWIGVNYYTPFRVAPAGGEASGATQDVRAYPGAPPFRFAPRPPVTAMGWEVEPVGLEEVLLTTARRAPGVPLRVTENGAAYDDLARTADGAVDDQDRIAYLRGHVGAVERARAAGAPVHDYIAWTLLDNFEWGEGYTCKFGLVEVEDGTLDRRPKASYAWYAQHVRGASAG